MIFKAQRQVGAEGFNQKFSDIREINLSLRPDFEYQNIKSGYFLSTTMKTCKVECVYYHFILAISTSSIRDLDFVLRQSCTVRDALQLRLRQLFSLISYQKCENLGKLHSATKVRNMKNTHFTGNRSRDTSKKGNYYP